MIGNNSSGVTKSILLITKNTGMFACFTRSITKRSPGPIFSEAFTTTKIPSTPLSALYAAFNIKSPNACFGL